MPCVLCSRDPSLVLASPDLGMPTCLQTVGFLSSFSPGWHALHGLEFTLCGLTPGEPVREALVNPDHWNQNNQLCCRSRRLRARPETGNETEGSGAMGREEQESKSCLLWGVETGLSGFFPWLTVSSRVLHSHKSQSAWQQLKTCSVQPTQLYQACSKACFVLFYLGC